MTYSFINKKNLLISETEQRTNSIIMQLDKRWEEEEVQLLKELVTYTINKYNGSAYIIGFPTLFPMIKKDDYAMFQEQLILAGLCMTIHEFKNDYKTYYKEERLRHLERRLYEELQNNILCLAKDSETQHQFNLILQMGYSKHSEFYENEFLISQLSKCLFAGPSNNFSYYTTMSLGKFELMAAISEILIIKYDYENYDMLKKIILDILISTQILDDLLDLSEDLQSDDYNVFTGVFRDLLEEECYQYPIWNKYIKIPHFQVINILINIIKNEEMINRVYCQIKYLLESVKLRLFHNIGLLRNEQGKHEFAFEFSRKIWISIENVYSEYPGYIPSILNYLAFYNLERYIPDT
ncbi:hypothetical protein [Paenibacillus sp. YN15]|uniref:hypothetical protein n=1 Tax=Paenibacillus sp. YN15 TaxID=1742774 RepID=UPI000DCDA3F4|nr:hypothetical protein [Paenibacillus sp. YN15]RAU91116.1 hypothetical protein DQG13_29870 [Paenibacillus sp. YN15]